MLGAKIASCFCYTAAVLPFLFSFAVFSSDVFCFFFEIPFHMKKSSAKGMFMSKESHEFLYAQSILSHTAKGSLIHCRRQSLMGRGVLGGYLPRAAPPSRCPLTRLPVGDYFTCYMSTLEVHILQSNCPKSKVNSLDCPKLRCKHNRQKVAY